MQLTDILPLEKWIRLEEDVYKMFGFDNNVFNIDGFRITDFKKWANRLCPAIKATDRGQSYICAVAHMNLAAAARNTKQPVIEECDAGLVKLVVPIFVNSKFLGAFGACGSLLDDGEIDTFLVNKTTGIDTEEIESLASDIDSITTAGAEAAVAYIKARIVSYFENQT
ncbi:MAG: PocR ligand-binding domain-containing protein [Proteobacteria bacterium]|nr:PocR ligand-binding domain-containing protein [Pseudomonadota bacterium]